MHGNLLFIRIFISTCMVKNDFITNDNDHIFHFDVCIIGGGIAGNFLASLLCSSYSNSLNSPISVCVVEEHSEIGFPFQCAGIVSQKLLSLVRIPKEIVLNRIDKAYLYSPNLQSICVSAQERPVVINRIAFDKYFAKKALEHGAVYFMKEKFLRFKQINKKLVEVQTNHRKITCNILVGADGPISQVGRQFGHKNIVIPAAQVRARINHPYNITSMYFNDRWRELFGYIVPEGKNGISRIGLACQHHTLQKLKQFLQILHVSSLSIEDRQGGIIPIGVPNRFVWDNVVLIGDSAGFVKATTGGGIIMILSAAKILAPAIFSALNNQDFSYQFFRRKYQRPFKRTLGIELKIHFLIRIFLLNLRKADYKRLFKFYQLSKIQKMVFDDADMDFPGRIIKKLLMTSEFWRYILPISFRYLKLVPIFIRIILT